MKTDNATQTEIILILLSDPEISKKLKLNSGFVAVDETIVCSCQCSDEEASGIFDYGKVVVAFFASQMIAGEDRMVPYKPQILSLTREGACLTLEILLQGIADDRGTTISFNRNFE